jgi:hypothetical protein
VLSGFTSMAIGKWARANLLPGTTVSSDGLGCFAAVTDAGGVHTPTSVGALKPRDLPEFMWINTVLGNLKTTLAGAFHSLNHGKYAAHYLAAFAYRLNRRFDLAAWSLDLSSMWHAASRSRRMSSGRMLGHVSLLRNRSCLGLIFMRALRPR